MSDQDQLAPCAGDRDIQTAVVEHESGPAGANERENHDIALATLKSLDGIDGDPGTRQHLTQQDDLSTEWRNNTDGFGIDAAIPREGPHELDNCPRFIRVGSSIAIAFDRNEHHRSTIRRSPFVGADTRPQTSVVKQSIRYFHNPWMHTVLRFDQRHVLHLAFQALEHRLAKLAGTNNGRKLAVVANQDKAARAKNESERERLGQLGGFINDGHFECGRPKIRNRRCAVRRSPDDGGLLKRLSDGTDTAVFARQIVGEEIGGIAGDLPRQFRRIRSSADTKKMRCGIMLQKCHKHLVYGRVGESAEQDAAPRAPYDLGNDSRFTRAGRAPNEVEHFAVRGAADGFDLAGVELREPPRLAFGSAPFLTQEGSRSRKLLS